MAAQSAYRMAHTTAVHLAAQMAADLDAQTEGLAAGWMDWRLGIESELPMEARQAAAMDDWKDDSWARDSAARRDDFLLAAEKEHKSDVAKAFPSAVLTE